MASGKLDSNESQMLLVNDRGMLHLISLRDPRTCNIRYVFGNIV